MEINRRVDLAKELNLAESRSGDDLENDLDDDLEDDLENDLEDANDEPVQAELPEEALNTPDPMDPLATRSTDIMETDELNQMAWNWIISLSV